MAAFGIGGSTDNTFVSNTLTLTPTGGGGPTTVGLSLDGAGNTVESNTIAEFDVGIDVADCDVYGPLCLDLYNDISSAEKWSCESCEEG